MGTKTIKPLVENIEINLWVRQWFFLDKAEVTKEKNTLTSWSWKLCVSKDTSENMKKLTEWENIFANHKSEKEIASRIYKELW